MSFEGLSMSTKNPSKQFRRILQNNANKATVNAALPQNINTFFHIIDFRDEINVFKDILQLWSIDCLHTRFSTFLFKFYNNSLGINTRLSHFNNNVSRLCSFCVVKKRNYEETFLHLFLGCDSVREWHDMFILRFFDNIQLNTEEQKKKFWFFGLLVKEEKFSQRPGLCIILFQYCLWECKLQKTVPSFNTLSLKYRDLLVTLVNGKPKWKEQFSLLNFFLRRF